MEFLIAHGWLILFVVWGLPLTYYRSRFRKMVYNTDDWIINIKPVFLLEIKALFGYYDPKDPGFSKLCKFYRFYLTVYILLFICYSYFR